MLPTLISLPAVTSVATGKEFRMIYVSLFSTLSIPRCNGGWTLRAFEYLRLEGVVTGGRYKEKGVCKPYAFYPCGRHANQKYYGECPLYGWPTPVCRKVCQRQYKKTWTQDKIWGSTAYQIAMDEKLIKKEIMTNGPVVASMRVFTDFYSYNGGVYVLPSSPQLLLKLFLLSAAIDEGWRQLKGGVTSFRIRHITVFGPHRAVVRGEPETQI
ncbi:hypothetical protein Y032_0023g813 [Ancylostoma ceylanicum]|uniref:Peptidase C1A papain C-terminal domain-containing protein n=1 Tax=Ancylostoma ceylanicum TaxID=53326 RepID=A0A016UX35_9BILA|nr:hypothetical protein Y032_0023g813 [Ancylostoma ceylanicum]